MWGTEQSLKSSRHISEPVFLPKPSWRNAGRKELKGTAGWLIPLVSFLLKKSFVYHHRKPSQAPQSQPPLPGWKPAWSKRPQERAWGRHTPRGKGVDVEFPECSLGRGEKGTLSMSTTIGLQVQAPLKVDGAQESSPQGRGPSSRLFSLFQQSL